jgi:hypothetical protein
MLNPHLQGGTTEPDGRGAPEVSDDGRMWRCRAGIPRDRGGFRQRNSLLVLFRNPGQGHSAPESAPTGRQSGEYRLSLSSSMNGSRRLKDSIQSMGTTAVAEPQ